MIDKARDIMTRKLIVVNENTTIDNLIRIFMENNISCVPVVSDEMKLIGIVTKTDILGYLMDKDIHLSLKHVLQDIFEYRSEHGDKDREAPSETEITVRDIMTPNPITCGEKTSVTSMAKKMIKKKIHRLIITRDNEIVGIVSTLDILYHVAGFKKMSEDNAIQ